MLVTPFDIFTAVIVLTTALHGTLDDGQFHIFPVPLIVSVPSSKIHVRLSPQVPLAAPAVSAGTSEITITAHIKTDKIFFILFPFL